MNKLYVTKVVLFLSIALAFGCARTRAQSRDTLGLDFRELLRGREAGLQVGSVDHAPASAFNAVIRGLKSFRGSNEPLFILDGMPLNPQRMNVYKTFINDDADFQAVINSLSVIDPRDIADVKVLKNALSTALYGHLGGANGVIVITTKRGGGQRPVVTWNSNVAFRTMARTKEMLGFGDYLGYLSRTAPGSELQSFKDYKVVDWQQEAARTGISHDHFVSVASQTRSTKFYISADYSNMQGILERSGSEAGNLKINFENRLGKFGRFGLNSLLNYTKTDMVQATTPVCSSGNVNRMVLTRPFLTDNDFANRTEGVRSDAIAENYASWLDDYDDHSDAYRFISSFWLEIDFAKWLRWKTVAGVDYRDERRKRWLGNEIEKGYAVNSMVGIGTLTGMRYMFDTSLNTDFAFGGGHELRAMAGISMYGDTYKNNVAEGYYFVFKHLRGLKDAERFPDGNGGISSSPVYNLYKRRTWNYAAFARVNYSYKGRYEAEAVLRADATARYNGMSDPDFWPAAGLRWNISEEPFMAGAKRVVSRLSLHADWGRSGAYSIEPYRNITGYVPEDVADRLPALDPERSKLVYNLYWRMVNEQYSAGLEAGLFGGRLNLRVDYYRSESSDDLSLWQQAFDASARRMDGFRSRGKVRNTGVELNLYGNYTSAWGLKWDAGLTLTFNRNKVLDTGFGTDYVGLSVGRMPGENQQLTANGVLVGHPVGAFYGYKTAGLVREENLLYAPAFNGQRLQQGDILFVDRDGDMNVTPSDRTCIGDPNPDGYGQFYTTFSWRGLTLSLTFDGMWGNDVMNLNLLSENRYATGNLDNISRKAYFRAWSQSRPDGTYPRMDAVGQNVISDRLVEDCSFLRLSDLRLRYDIPLPGRTKWIRGLFVSAAVRNLFVFTSYSGYDPEVNGFGFDALRWGLDNGAYPSSRTYILSIGAKF